MPTGLGELSEEVIDRILRLLWSRGLNWAALCCRGWREQIRRIPRRLQPMDAEELDRAKGTVALGGAWLFRSKECRFAPAAAQQLARVLPGSGVVGLRLRNCSIGAEGMAALALALPACRSLTQLDLAVLDFVHNKFGDEGAVALAAALPSCRGLTCLRLSSSSVRLPGVSALAAALPASLQTLAFTHLKIGDRGAADLAAALTGCTGLTELGLSCGNISNGGAAALAAILPGCAALTAIELDHNAIRSKGAAALFAVLPRCASITRLNLQFNAVRNQGAAALAAALRAGAAVDVLRLDHNNIGTWGKAVLASSLSDLDPKRLPGLRRELAGHTSGYLAGWLPVILNQ